MEDGRCTDSMALTTARQYHIEEQVLNRAETLLQAFDNHCRPSNHTLPVITYSDQVANDVIETKEVSKPIKTSAKRGNTFLYLLK